IERLTPDFIYSTGQNASCNPGAKDPALFAEYFTEAPVFFHRGTAPRITYYALFSHCCCFCMQGSGLIVHTASHPLGPWKALNNGRDIGCRKNTGDASLSLSKTVWPES